MDGDDREGVAGSFLISGLKGEGIDGGGGARNRAGLAGALPLALALGLNSRMKWDPGALRFGLGVLGTGGLP